ncbi:hypothetical protein CJT55_31845, partial [Pseudomonas aeruginosa]
RRQFVAQGQDHADVVAVQQLLLGELLQQSGGGFRFVGGQRLVILNAWTLLYAGRLAEAEDCIGQLARFLPMPSASRQRVLL